MLDVTFKALIPQHLTRDIFYKNKWPHWNPKRPNGAKSRPINFQSLIACAMDKALLIADIISHWSSSSPSLSPSVVLLNDFEFAAVIQDGLVFYVSD